MSKLSDYAKSKDPSYQLKDPEKFKETVEYLYDRISNLEFDVWEYHKESKLYLIVVDNILVLIDGSARTTSYGLKISSAKTEDNLKKEIEDKNWTYIDNIGKNDEYVDIQELLIYCNDKAKKFKSRKDVLNEEIDKGFKRPLDFRAPLGGNDKDDVAYNDWLHRKLR